MPRVATNASRIHDCRLHQVTGVPQLAAVRCPPRPPTGAGSTPEYPTEYCLWLTATVLPRAGDCALIQAENADPDQSRVQTNRPALVADSDRQASGPSRGLCS